MIMKIAHVFAKIGLLRYSYNKTMSPCGGLFAGAGGTNNIYLSVL